MKSLGSLREDLNPAWVGPEFMRRGKIRFGEYRWPVLSRERATRMQNLLTPIIRANPCPGHPDRCQSTNKFRGQCTNWREKGHYLCTFHICKQFPDFRTLDNPYVKQASVKFLAYMEGANDAAQDVMDTSAEIEVLRALVMRAVEKYSQIIDPEYRKKVKKTGELNEEELIRLETFARQDLAEAISNVTEATNKLAKTVQARKDALNPQILASLWLKQQKVHQDVLRDHPELLQEIEGRISTLVRPLIEDSSQTIVVE